MVTVGRDVILGNGNRWDVSDTGVWGKGGDGYPSLFQQESLDHPDESSADGAVANPIVGPMRRLLGLDRTPLHWQH